jgi:hypothetical protein
VIGGDADGSLRFWDAASGAKLWTLPVQYIWASRNTSRGCFRSQPAARCS